MAKFQVGPGMDKYLSQLRNLEYSGPETLGPAIYKGAGIVADAVKKNIEALPESACTPVEKAGLLEGFGIARMQDENGYWQVKLGFEGYNANKTKKYPKGKANAMIARSIEGGTSRKPKYPFVAPAVRSTRKQAEMAMAEEVDKQITRQMGS